MNIENKLNRNFNAGFKSQDGNTILVVLVCIVALGAAWYFFVPKLTKEKFSRDVLEPAQKLTQEQKFENPTIALENNIENCEKLITLHGANAQYYRKEVIKGEDQIKLTETVRKNDLDFLNKAKSAYKEAAEKDQWPVMINNLSYSEQTAGDAIIKAQEKITENNERIANTKKLIEGLKHKLAQEEQKYKLAERKKKN